LLCGPNVGTGGDLSRRNRPTVHWRKLCREN